MATDIAITRTVPDDASGGRFEQVVAQSKLIHFFSANRFSPSKTINLERDL